MEQIQSYGWQGMSCIFSKIARDQFYFSKTAGFNRSPLFLATTGKAISGLFGDNCGATDPGS
jgi:hypothetical protein